MIYPIVAYGSPVLRTIAKPIDETYPDLKQLISDMVETLGSANGVGLAAPQINLPIRLIVIDATPFTEEDERAANFKRAFINPYIVEEDGEEWGFNEGCLSIPGINEDVFRKSRILLKYCDENMQSHEEYFDGILARIIQHEHDHLEGKTFIDRVNPLRRIFLKRKLEDISKGAVEHAYKMKFPIKSRP